MSKKMQQKRGILTTPQYDNGIVQINSKGVITISKANITNVKRPKQYK